MAQGAHKITQQFEEELCQYTGAPYCIAVDNCSNALFLSLYYELNVNGKSYTGNGFEWHNNRLVIKIPSNTYPSVPCEIIHAGGEVEFWDNGIFRTGSYRLMPTRVWDSALSFTHRMYKFGQIMCLSFTGPYKHLKLGKGGAILTNDLRFANWAKRARFSGRQECSYHEDNFDEEIKGGDYIDKIDRYVNFHTPPVAGWNFYMMPEIAARGLLLLQQFYNQDGTPKSNKDLSMTYPDLSKFKIFRQ